MAAQRVRLGSLPGGAVSSSCLQEAQIRQFLIYRCELQLSKLKNVLDLYKERLNPGGAHQSRP